MTTPTLRKAAVFLAALPDHQAAALLARLSPEQAAAVSAEVAVLPPVEPQERESIAREFMAAGFVPSKATSKVTVPFLLTQKLGQSPPQKSGQSPGFSPPAEAPCKTLAFPNLPQGTTAPFEFLHGIASEDLVSLLRDEHPQTVALIVSRLPASRAADVLTLFPADRQAAVVARIAATGEPPSEEIVREVSAALERKFHGPATVPIARGMSNVAKLFGSMRPATERKLLGGIAEADPDLYREIRRAMFGPIVAEAG